MGHGDSYNDSMRFRLKTLLAITTLVALGLGVYWWYQYFESLKLISVTARTEALTELDPPAEIRVRFGAAALKELAEEEKAFLEFRALSKNKSSYWTVSRILAQPLNASRASEQWLISKGVDSQALKQQLPPLLLDTNVELDSRIHYANLLVNLGDPRGLGWMVDHLKSENPRSTNGYEFIVFTNAPLEWLEGVDVWPLIQPRSKHDRFDYQRHAADRLCPSQWYDFYLEKLRDPTTDPEWRFEMARWFHYANPTLEALEASAFLFVPPDENYKWSHKPYHLFLQKYFEVGDPEITKRATELAKPLALDRHQFSREYFKLIAAHGDESCDEFFRKHLQTPLLQDRAFVALADRSQDPITAFWEAIEAGSPFERVALRQLQYRLAKSNDPKLCMYFENKFNRSNHKFEKSQALFGLLQLHADSAMDYYKKLYAAFPEDYGDPNRVGELVNLLHSYNLGQDLVSSAIVVDSMRSGKPGVPFLPSEHVAVLVKQAGLSHNVDMLDLADEQLLEFEAMSRGELEINSIVPKYLKQAIAFDLNGIVYEFEILEPDVFYDPHLMADILNAILARQDISNRFIAHDVDGSDAYFFYGPPELAKQLRDEFEVEFMPGTEAYLDEGK